MANTHGRKPKSPTKMPRVNGRKPPTPKAHKSSGSSSTGTRTMALVATAIFAPGFLAFLAAVAYIVKGNS
jgi:hypothetical protein